MKRYLPSFAAVLVFFSATASIAYVDDMTILIPTTPQEEQTTSTTTSTPSETQTTSVATSTVPEDPKLLAHWSFDSTDQETRYYDVTGNGHTAIGTSVSVIDGIKGKALNCSDSTFDISIESSTGDFNLPNFTIEGMIYSYVNMVNPGSAENFRSIFEYILVGLNSSITGGYNLQITDNGKLYLSMAPGRTGDWIKCESDAALLPKTWYHIAATYDGSLIKLYVNGTVAKQTGHTGGFTSSPIAARIGSQIRVSDTLATSSEIIDRFNGKIDELKLYNYALSSDTITAHFASYDIPEPPEPEPKLLAHWSFDSSSNNTTFYDVTGNGFDATCSKTLATQAGVRGQALESNVTGYSFHVANSQSAFTVPNFTIESLVYMNVSPLETNTFHLILSHQTYYPGLAEGYEIDICNKGTVQFCMAHSNTAWTYCHGTTRLVPKTWYHVVGTYDGKTMRIYLNGQLEGRVSHSNGGYVAPHQDASIGCQEQNDGVTRNWFNGMLDELKFFNYTLSADSIATHFAAYELPQPPEELSLEINLGMKTTYALAGDTVVVPVYIANHEDYSISSIQLTLKYDPEQLTLLSISNDSGLVRQWELFDWNSTTAGSIPVAMAGVETRLAYGEGELFRCVFEVAGSLYNGDTCMITLNDIDIDEKKNLIPVTVQNGRIIISHDAILYGDVTGNKEVTIIDAQAVLRYVVGALQLPDDCCPDFTIAVADVSGNGAITSYDAALIFQYSLGLIPAFPVESVSSRLLAKRMTTATDEARFTFKMVSSSESEVVYDLVGTNLRGFHAGEFAIACNASGEILSKSIVATEIRGATFSSRFNTNDNLLKVAVSSNDDIDDDSPVTLLRITLPPMQQAVPEFAIKTALINEGAILTEFENSGLVGVLPSAVERAPVGTSVRLVKNLLTVHSAGSNPVTLTIWDLHGRQIARHAVTALQTTFDLSRYGRGAYIFRLQEGLMVTGGRFMLINR
ncbi:MAG: hypothetical protein JW913_07375 [Chitinispirillaceae bacterium]|nr:hypothetical protein [Chitinispirillaceae bacterium]